MQRRQLQLPWAHFSVLLSSPASRLPALTAVFHFIIWNNFVHCYGYVGVANIRDFGKQCYKHLEILYHNSLLKAFSVWSGNFKSKMWD